MGGPVPIDGHVPTDVLAHAVQVQTRPFSVRRQTDNSDTETLGAPASADFTDIGTRDLFLYGQNAGLSREDEGAVVTAQLRGYCLTETDIQPQDRLDYGQFTYEVVSATDKPTAAPVVTELRFERV